MPWKVITHFGTATEMEAWGGVRQGFCESPGLFLVRNWMASVYVKQLVWWESVSSQVYMPTMCVTSIT